MGTITLTSLGKAYKQYSTHWARLKEWFIPFSKPHHQLKWILHDINVTVNAGEAVGIIGINGAGKSTLLKIITGTTQPTTGSVNITGRVAALLELGMGFHPDFTGRQNVYMAGQLLGMSVEEIAGLMPEIEAFAEIGDYMDEPVRIYSSGMQMRVAFSVATAKRPDILIVDEALSVGDAYFQHKSFDRIRKFREMGTTLLLVSHDRQAIQAVCDQAILLDAGRIVMKGRPEEVFDYYHAAISDRQKSSVKQHALGNEKKRTEFGTHAATINKVSLKSKDGSDLQVVGVGQEIEIHISVQVHRELESLVLGCGIKDRYGQMIFGTNTHNTKQELRNCCQGDELLFVFKVVSALGVGSYSINVAIHPSDFLGDNKYHYHWLDNAVVFQVVNFDKLDFVGCAWTDMVFSISKRDQNNNRLIDCEQTSTNNSTSENTTHAMGKINIANTSYGQMLVYQDDQIIGRSLVASGAFQESKISEVVDYLKKEYAFNPELFIDIGANIGTHLIYALNSRLFGRAIGIEANSENFKLLQSNVLINELSEKADLFRVALSDKTGALQMELSNENYGDHRIRPTIKSPVTLGEELERKVVDILAVTVDEFFEQHSYSVKNALIWLDTQGHEGHIFDGAASTFYCGEPYKFIVTEFWPYGLERSGGKASFFKFISNCKKVLDINAPNWQRSNGLHPSDLEVMYDEMLIATRKDSHPHTDLLLVL